MHSAEEWEELLLPEIERQQKLGKEVVFRADAAFAKPEVYEALEERDLVELFGDEYRRYRQRVSMLVPWRKSA